MAKKCLVICPFGKEGSPIRKRSDQIFDQFIKPVATEKGYDETYRLIDNAQPGLISNQMIQDLYSADLVIADLTNSNPNVFYELALRHSVAKPIIHISDNIEKIPFDINQVNVIKIEIETGQEAMEFVDKLKSQIQKINQGQGHFINFAWELHPFRPISDKIKGETSVKVYNWEIRYTTTLATDWLHLQDDGLQKCVESFLREDKAPCEPLYRSGLAEYIGYKLSQGNRLFGDLYYIINNENGTFLGWGNFSLPGSSDPLAIRIDGEDKIENNMGTMIVNFSQPSRKNNSRYGHTGRNTRF